MEIRFAEPQDIPQLLELLLQVGQVHHRGRPDLFRSGAQKYDASALLTLLADENRPVFVAVEEERVLGYGFCIRRVWKNDPVMTDHTSLYIDDLCVDEAFRGRHIGQALYAFIRDYARKEGFGSVTLNVWACNEEARKFYEKCGLKPQKIGLEDLLEDQ